jgi:hypothetical protein
MTEVCSVTADRYSHVQNELIDMVGQRNTYRMRAMRAETLLDQISHHLHNDGADCAALLHLFES